MKRNNMVTILFVSVLLSFLCGSLGGYLVMMNTEKGQNIIKNITKSEYKEDSIADAVEKIYDAVVLIKSYKEDNLTSTGTGFVYKKDKNYAYILTNNHVVNDIDSVKVMLSDNSIIDAKIKGKETYSDIAVLTIEASKIDTIATIGDSTKINTGDTVFTIGSPQGEEYFGSVTKGILSGKDRLVAVSYSGVISDYYMKVLQTDAPINPGNSGGPLCNINGDVIGITNMKLVDGSVEGMGFAIPIEDALNYAEMIETDEKIIRPFFGISMLDVSTDSYYLWQNNISIPEGVDGGVVVLEVQKDSPAADAGFEKGDIILQLGKTKVKTVAEFRYELYKHKVGETVEVKYLRNSKVKKAKVTLKENSN